MTRRTTPFETMAEIRAYLDGESIECLECGKRFRALGGTHLLRVHGLAPDEYRARWGIPRGAALAVASVRRARSEIIKAAATAGALTYDHLPDAMAAARIAPRPKKAPAQAAVHADMLTKTRPGDARKLPSGARRADGRDADRAREYQRQSRAKKAAEKKPSAV